MIWTTWSSRGIQVLSVLLFITGLLTHQFLIVTTAIFLLSGLILSHYLATQAFRNLRIHTDPSHAILEIGEEIDLSLTIANPLKIAAGVIQLRQGIPYGLSCKENFIRTEFSLAQRQQARVRMTVQGKFRGRWVFAPMDFYQTDVLGWAQMTVQKTASIMVTVWPQRVGLPENFWKSARRLGEMKGQWWDEPDPSLYRGIRSYQPGDSWRSVHPYASMRMNELMVKEVDFTRAFQVEVICHPITNLESWYGIDRDQAEDCFTLAASAIESALNQDYACGLTISCPLPGFSHGTSMAPGTGPAVLADYLTDLAWAIPSGFLSANLEGLMNQIIMRHGLPSLVIVVSPLWDSRVNPFLQQLANQGSVTGWLTTSESRADYDLDIIWRWKKGREIYAEYMARVI